MRNLFRILLLCTIANQTMAQHANSFDQQGKMYMYWGWNKSAYSASDMTFSGNHYDFTLNKVKANDRQSPFAFREYFNPKYVTIPQYNFRLGYFIKKDLDVSIAIDHMKYVMPQDQTVGIEGRIDSTGSTHDGVYQAGDQKQLSDDFLTFEHTDGLNYVNAGVRKHMQLKRYRTIFLNGFVGASAGVMLPKTNTQLLSKERYDAVHLSGWGLAGVTGLQITWKNILFAQGELKGGYINMGDVRTTKDPTDKASHSFYYGQWNIVFGGSFFLFKPKKESSAKIVPVGD